MLSWLIANTGTILIISVLILLIGLIIFSMVRDKKRGKSSCGGNCVHCPMGGSCHRD